MNDLIKSQLVCVLATVSGNQPHCSLMSYAVDQECREIDMFTFKNTKKYRNLTTNPAVSILIDNRNKNGEEKKGQTIALTINGLFEEIQNQQKRESIRQRLSQKHPQLQKLMDDPNVEFFSVRIQSMLLLEGLVESSFATID